MRFVYTVISSTMFLPCVPTSERLMPSYWNLVILCLIIKTSQEFVFQVELSLNHWSASVVTQNSQHWTGFSQDGCKSCRYSALRRSLPNLFRNDCGNLWPLHLFVVVNYFCSFYHSVGFSLFVMFCFLRQTSKCLRKRSKALYRELNRWKQTEWHQANLYRSNILTICHVKTITLAWFIGILREKNAAKRWAQLTSGIGRGLKPPANT